MIYFVVLVFICNYRYFRLIGDKTAEALFIIKIDCKLIKM